MKRKRIEFLIIGLTILGVAAGVVAGLLISRLPTTEVANGSAIEQGPLSAELKLTDTQRDQMKAIWENVRIRAREPFDEARRLEKQRDDALVALLNEEQKAKFEKISKEFADQFAELTRNRDQTFLDAVAQTKKLLNDEQRQKYDEILKDHLTPGGEPGFGPPPLEPLGTPSK